jgi:hypothetical protein
MKYIEATGVRKQKGEEKGRRRRGEGEKIK